MKLALSVTTAVADDLMIKYCVSKIDKQIHLRASFKKTQLVFNSFDLIDDEDYDRIITEVIERFNQYTCQRIGHKKLLISWKPEVMPKLTARDLVHAGYTDYDKFKLIFDQLRLAILEGHVNNDTTQANLIWVKEKFPLE